MLWPSRARESPPRLTQLNAAAVEGSPSFSPDGLRVAYAAGGIRLLTLSTKAETPLEGSEAGDRDPAFAPDGATIAFLRAGAGGVSRVCLLPVTPGGPVRCIASLEFTAGMDWIRDGRYVVVSHKPSNEPLPVLSVVDVSSGRVQRLSPTSSGDRWPSVSPRGRAVSFVRDGAYWVYELDGSPPAVRRTRKLAPPAVAPEHPAAWSFDSRYLFFAAGGKLWKLGFNARARPQLLAEVEDATGAVASPRGGMRLVFARPGGLFLLGRILILEDAKPLAHARGAETRSLQVSPACLVDCGNAAPSVSVVRGYHVLQSGRADAARTGGRLSLRRPPSAARRTFTEFLS